MDYARREFLLTLRRVIAAMLCLVLLVAFWADRPLAAGSYPALPADSPLRDAASPPPEEPRGTSIISWVRRPWLLGYTLAGAPVLNRGWLSEEEEGRFRVAVGRLAALFFLAAGVLWWRGQRLIAQARNPSA